MEKKRTTQKKSVQRKTENKNVYKDKNKPIFSFLYYYVIICLVGYLIVIYVGWRNDQKNYAEAIRRANETESALTIEARTQVTLDELADVPTETEDAGE